MMTRERAQYLQSIRDLSQGEYWSDIPLAYWPHYNVGTPRTRPDGMTQAENRYVSMLAATIAEAKGNATWDWAFKDIRDGGPFSTTKG